MNSAELSAICREPVWVIKLTMLLRVQLYLAQRRNILATGTKKPAKAGLCSVGIACPNAENISNLIAMLLELQWRRSQPKRRHHYACVFVLAQ